MGIEQTILWSDFEKIDIRVGTIIEADNFDGLRNPAIKLRIDFGELGMKNSSAQITDFYQPQELIGKQIIGIVNFPPKQIKNFFSEVLVLGVYGDNNQVTLLATDKPVKNGSKVG